MVAAVFASTLLSVVLAGSPESYLKFPPDHREDLLTHFVCELPPESEVGEIPSPHPIRSLDRELAIEVSPYSAFIKA